MGAVGHKGCTSARDRGAVCMAVEFQQTQRQNDHEKESSLSKGLPAVNALVLNMPGSYDLDWGMGLVVVHRAGVGIADAESGSRSRATWVRLETSWNQVQTFSI